MQSLLGDKMKSFELLFLVITDDHLQYPEDTLGSIYLKTGRVKLILVLYIRKPDGLRVKVRI